MFLHTVLSFLAFKFLLAVSTDQSARQSEIYDKNKTLVKLSDGWLRGTQSALITGNGYYYSFKGIPYARPPIGELRFKAAQPVVPWEGVRDASEHGDQCYQFDIFTNSIRNGSEDCLFVNVYTQNLTPVKPLPVLLYIYGGAWKSGSGDSYYFSPDFIVQRDIVVVTFNYRLEVLGFLSLENDDVPGNAAMKDQVAVLKWIQKNIYHFGGDPTKVTISGQSAGGASVGLHLLSPLSKGLYHRAIMQSGSPLSDWVISPLPKERAYRLGESLGYEGNDDFELYSFLNSQPKENLINKDINLLPFEHLATVLKRLWFSPVVEKESDDSFITMEPREYLEKGMVADVDLLIGYTNGEALFVGNQLETSYDVINSFTDYYLTRHLAVETSSATGYEISKIIRNKYVGFENVSDINLDKFIDHVSTSGFTFDVHKFLRLLPKSHQTHKFLYRFSAITERNFYTIANGPTRCQIGGVAHFDDLAYIFHQPCGNLTADPTSEGIKIVNQVSDMWANFVKYGNPTPDESLGYKWKVYTLQDKDYLEIGNVITPSKELDEESYQFWTYVNALADKIRCKDCFITSKQSKCKQRGAIQRLFTNREHDNS